MFKKLISKLDATLHEGEIYCNTCKKWVDPVLQSNVDRCYCPECFTVVYNKFSTSGKIPLITPREDIVYTIVTPEESTICNLGNRFLLVTINCDKHLPFYIEEDPNEDFSYGNIFWHHVEAWITNDDCDKVSPGNRTKLFIIAEADIRGTRHRATRSFEIDPAHFISSEDKLKQVEPIKEEPKQEEKKITIDDIVLLKYTENGEDKKSPCILEKKENGFSYYKLFKGSVQDLISTEDVSYQTDTVLDDGYIFKSAVPLETELGLEYLKKTVHLEVIEVPDNARFSYRKEEVKDLVDRISWWHTFTAYLLDYIIIPVHDYTWNGGMFIEKEVE